MYKVSTERHRTEPRLDRGSAADQDRWLAELEEAAEAEGFPQGGSLILSESRDHALAIAAEMRAKGHRAITRGVYVLTTCVLEGDAP